MIRNIFVFLVFTPALGAQTTYDLLLKGGHVIDPKNRINAVMDVGIADGRIARVAPSIPSSEAKKTINLAGLTVTPGLIDIHVHVYPTAGAEVRWSATAACRWTRTRSAAA